MHRNRGRSNEESSKAKGAENGGWYVFSDTHFGLAPDRDDIDLSGETSDPEQVGKFINWLIDVKNHAIADPKVNVLDEPSKPESYRKPAEVPLKGPSKLIMLGDMLDLWDSTDREAEFSSRPIFNLIDKLDCEKTYIIGNHDYELKSLVGNYPSGKTQVQLKKGCYYIPESSGEAKKSYAFVHGYEFQKGFGIGIWKHFSTIRSPALAIGDYMKFLIWPLLIGLILFTDLYIGLPLSVLILTLFFERFCRKRLIYLELVVLVLFLGSWLYRGLSLGPSPDIPLYLLSPLLLVLVTAFLLTGLSRFYHDNTAISASFSVLALVYLLQFFVYDISARIHDLQAILSSQVVDQVGRPIVAAWFFVWLLITAPALVYKCGIHLWRTFASVRYVYVPKHPHVGDWLRKFKEEQKLQEKDLSRLAVVYGHTHFMNQSEVEKASFINLPSWVKDMSKGAKHVDVVRNTFLYIDPDIEGQSWLFLGWDWHMHRPFQIPWGIVEARMKAEVETGKGYLPTLTSSSLLHIGWPPIMVAEWIGWRECIASGREISKQALFGDRAKVKMKMRLSKERVEEERKQIVMTSCCWKLAYEEHIKGKHNCPYCGKDLSKFETSHKWEDMTDEWLTIYDKYIP